MNDTAELIIAIGFAIVIIVSSALEYEWLGALFGLGYVASDIVGIALSD